MFDEEKIKKEFGEAAIKLQRIGEKTKWRLEDWARDNEEVLKPVIPIVAGTIGFATREAIRGNRRRKEAREQACKHWCPRTSEWVYTRRPLKPAEQRRLSELYGSGMTKYEALKTMGLLRY